MPAQYFKERKGFDRLFILLKDKYISLGRHSGTVTLKNITQEESRDLSNFFGQTITPSSEFKTSFKKIEKKLKETRYANFSWDKLFKDYFKEEIQTKQEIKQNFIKEEKEFYQEIINNVPQSKTYINKTLEKQNATYKLFLRRYKKDKNTFKKDLTWIFKLIYMLPKVTPTSLVMLSSITGNPHFLDLSTANSNLFFKILSEQENNIEPITTNEKITFLENHNIYIDMFSNYIITYGLKSDSSFITNFTKANQVLNLNLSNLRYINNLDTESKQVFIFENPSLLPLFKNENIPVIITSGMPNATFYETIEKLINSNNKIYYNGDFDPEGLVIASKIKEKFPSVKLFCYDKQDYLNSKSQEQINASSLKKLNSVGDKELITIKNLLLENKCAAYQEKNIKRIYDFVLKTKK